MEELVQLAPRPGSVGHPEALVELLGGQPARGAMIPEQGGGPLALFVGGPQL